MSLLTCWRPSCQKGGLPPPPNPRWTTTFFNAGPLQRWWLPYRQTNKQTVDIKQRLEHRSILATDRNRLFTCNPSVFMLAWHPPQLVKSGRKPKSSIKIAIIDCEARCTNVTRHTVPKHRLRIKLGWRTCPPNSYGRLPPIPLYFYFCFLFIIFLYLLLILFYFLFWEKK